MPGNGFRAVCEGYEEKDDRGKERDSESGKKAWNALGKIELHYRDWIAFLEERGEHSIIHQDNRKNPDITTYHCHLAAQPQKRQL